MDEYMAVLQKFGDFSTRSRRREYWMFALFNLIAAVVLGIVDSVVGLKMGGIGLLGAVYALAVLIPSLAVSVRRLHDTGKSGWWLLIACIPLIGALVLLFFMVQDSDAHPNEYGPNPKAESVFV